uniref:Family with sequence similarity 13 member C n=1 Tax=Xiphophorus maculatus TaxID=8083 RepID=A0A3B5QPT5_XIPMA
MDYLPLQGSLQRPCRARRRLCVRLGAQQTHSHAQEEDQITRQQRTLMKPFYDRYRLLKQLLSSASTPQFTSSVEMSGTPVVSPLDEGKTFHAQIITMATLHEASRYSFSAYRQELLDHLRMVRLEKRRLHQTLQEFEDRFYAQTGRVCQKEDRGPMAEEYCQYKNLKAKLRLLEALLSKQDSTKAS